MFAVIRTGGKQYKVQKDDTVVIEKLIGEPGTVIKIGEVLMIGDPGKDPAVGSPILKEAGVFAEVLGHSKSRKVLVFKKKRRQNYRRTSGHRQEQTTIKIIEVSPNGVQSKKSVEKKIANQKKSARKKVAPKADRQNDNAKRPVEGGKSKVTPLKSAKLSENQSVKNKKKSEK